MPSRLACFNLSFDDFWITDPLQQERWAPALRVDGKSTDVEESCDGALRKRDPCDVIECDRLNISARIPVSQHDFSRREKILSPSAKAGRAQQQRQGPAQPDFPPIRAVP